MSTKFEIRVREFEVPLAREVTRAKVLPRGKEEEQAFHSFLNVCVQQGYGYPIPTGDIFDRIEQFFIKDRDKRRDNIVIFDDPRNKYLHLFVHKSGLMFLAQDLGLTTGENYTRAKEGKLMQPRGVTLEDFMKEMDSPKWNSKVVGRSDTEDDFTKEQTMRIINHYTDRVTTTLKNKPKIGKGPVAK